MPRKTTKPTLVCEVKQTEPWAGVRYHKTKYPWRELAVGQSFIVPCTVVVELGGGYGAKALAHIRTNAWRWQERLGCRFRCRLLSDGGIEVAKESLSVSS